MGAGGAERLPWRRVDLFLRGSLGGRGDRLYRRIPVVRGLPINTGTSHTLYVVSIQHCNHYNKGFQIIYSSRYQALLKHFQAFSAHFFSTLNQIFLSYKQPK